MPFVGYFTMPLEYLFMSLGPSFVLLLCWFLDYVIWELVCVHSWDEHSVWLFLGWVGVWLCGGGSLGILWWLMGELTVLLLLCLGLYASVIGLWSLWLGCYPCDWTLVPVIGLITPVIGLWSLWLGLYPCDWAFMASVIGFLPLWTNFGFDVLYEGWYGGLEVGVGSSFLVLCIREFLVIIRLIRISVDISLFFVMGWLVPLRLLFQLVSCLWTRCLIHSLLNIGFIWRSLCNTPIFHSYTLLQISNQTLRKLTSTQQKTGYYPPHLEWILSPLWQTPL